MIYKGYKCAECKKVFEDNDDIVVCPECGAPHHRECYLKNGTCSMASYHSENFKYLPEKSEEKILEEQKKEEEQRSSDKADTRNNTGNFYPNGMRESILVYGGVDPNDKIDDIPVKVLARYVGTSSGNFIRKWKMSEKGLGGSFSALTFLLGPFYLLYRKLWGLGLVTLLFSLVASIPNCIYILYDMSGGNGDISFWYNLLTVFSYISFIVRAVISFCFNRLYLSKAKKDISAGKFIGGTSFAAVLLGLFITFIFSFVLAALIAK